MSMMRTYFEDHSMECDQCEEKFTGAAVGAYLKEVETDDGEITMLCDRCIKHEDGRVEGTLFDSH